MEIIVEGKNIRGREATIAVDKLLFGVLTVRKKTKEAALKFIQQYMAKTLHLDKESLQIAIFREITRQANMQNVSNS